MYELNDKIRNLKPYDPISGEYQIRLDANESFLPIPEDLRAEILQRIDEAAWNRYPDPTAAGVCRAFGAYYGVPEECIAAGNGSDELIMILLSSFLKRGEKLLTISPDFSMYRFYGSLAEAENVSLTKPDTLRIDPDDVIRTIRETGARLVIFSNPCNPTGQGLTRDEVRKIITSVDALVVLDEAYMDFWNESMIQEAARYDNLIILRTCSKAFGMAAIRLGFAVANKRLADVIRAVKSPYNVNTFTQLTGEIVLSHQDLLREGTKKIVESAAALAKEIAAISQEFPGSFTQFPTCTNFVFLRSERAEKIFKKLLNRKIAVRFFRLGEVGDFLRITAGNPDENAALCAALREILKEG